MVSVYDMRTGSWYDGEGEDEGPGHGGCRAPRPSTGSPLRAVPRLELALMPVVPSGRASQVR
jgi:hypothetical protein